MLQRLQSSGQLCASALTALEFPPPPSFSVVFYFTDDKPPEKQNAGRPRRLSVLFFTQSFSVVILVFA